MTRKIIVVGFFLLLCLPTPYVLGQSKPFEFKGHISQVNSGKIQLIIDSIPGSFVKVSQKNIDVHNGNFEFNGEISFPQQLRFVLNDSLITSYFYLDVGKSTGTFEKITAQSIKANVNSKTNIENQIIERRLASFNNKIEDWFENYSRINKEFKNDIPSDIEDSLAKEKKIIRVEIDSVLSKYILNHRDSYAALWHLFNIVEVGGYSPTRFASFLKFPRSLQKTKIGEYINKLLLSTQKNSIGANFTNIRIYDSSNLKFESKNLLTSKYTLVDFWFSHCAPCIAEFPNFKELCLNYPAEDFKIIGISIDKKTDRNVWIKTININSLSWPQYWDIDGKNASFLGITGFPQNFLLDKNGIILGKNLTTSQIKSFLSKKLL